MPGGGMATTTMTLGFDPDRGHFTGTFVGSMMTHLWLHQGTPDPDRGVLTSRVLSEDGTWTHLMTMNYRRR